MMPSRLPRLFFLFFILSFASPLKGQSTAPSPDFDGDGTVGFGDFLLFVQHFGTRQGDANFNARFDLDSSGEIGFLDFVQFSQKFGQKVESPPPPTLIETRIDPAAGGTVSLAGGPEIQIPVGSLSGEASLRIERAEAFPVERKSPDALAISDLFDINVQGGTIVGPIGLAIPYDPSKLSAGSGLSDVFAAFWDGQNWRRVFGVVNSETQQIFVETNHLSQWAGLVGKTLRIERLLALPEKLLAPPTGVQTFELSVTADTRDFGPEELEVVLSFEAQVAETFTPSGQFVLNDDGNPSGATSQPDLLAPGDNPMFSFSDGSADPTAPADGIYGARLSFPADPLLEQIQAIRVTCTIKPLNVQGIVEQREIMIPVEMVQERLSIRLLAPIAGEVVDPNPIFTWEADFLSIGDFGLEVTSTDRVTVFIDDDPNLFGEFFSPAGFQRKAITVTGTNWLQIRESLPPGDYWWGIEAFHDATRQKSRTDTPVKFRVSGVERYADNLPQSDPQDRLPKITIQTPQETQSGILTLAYTIEDKDQNANDLTVTFTSSFKNGNVHLISTTHGTIVDPGGGRYVIKNVPSPSSPTFVWNSRNGLDDKLLRDVRIQFSLGDDLDRGPRLATSGAFVVDNTRTATPSDSTTRPVLSVQPFEIVADLNPTETEVLIQNAGTGTLVWTITKSEAWIRVTSIQGSTDGKGRFTGEHSASLTVHTLGIGLPGGLQESTLKIRSNGGNLDIPVSINVPPWDVSSSDVPTGVEVTSITTLAGTQHQMVTVPAGEFAMGSDAGETSEQPVHNVFLDAFKIDRFEVSNAHYEAYVTAAGGARSQFADDGNYNGPNQPVVGVSWIQANAYCKWIGGRLPTEAEWEKAARGLDNRTYPWGNDPPTAELLNHNRTVGTTQDVGSYLKGMSPYGLHDMAGNVWEWVSDWFDETYYTNSPDRNPIGPADIPGQDRKVVRGGSWGEEDSLVRATRREPSKFQFRNALTGFRCVIPPPPVLSE